MNLRFAFAINKQNQFDERFFGNADKFAIYELVSGRLEQLFEIENEFKDDAIDDLKINEQKAESITKKLLTNDIKVIVSKQFGENIKLVNEYFIPVKIFSDLPDDAIQAINSHVHWIQDELNNFRSGYKLFTIKSGILKTSIENNKII
ncbi:MAG: hypothetical protein R6V23_13010 [Bacteroidales bacterium]